MKISMTMENILSRIANTTRAISLEAVERVGSGHAGLPLGCAEIGAYLFGSYLRLHPAVEKWPNRDMFVLSAGHGSIWLYSFLHLMGYGIEVEDLKQYRKIGSKTSSHPEFGKTVGIEATTGTDGQGIGFGVGQALALKILGAKFNTPEYKLFDNKVIILAGDGCLMEGISSEVSSFAGHTELNNLILIYDSNKTCLDGLVSETFSENVQMRYQSCGWDVHEIDGHNFEEIGTLLASLRNAQLKPTLIIANTIIGKGAENTQGTPLAHSGPLGKDSLQNLKNNLGVNDDPFAVPEDVYQFFNTRMENNRAIIQHWHENFNSWAILYPEKAVEYYAMQSRPIAVDVNAQLQKLIIPNTQSGRKSSHEVVNLLANNIPSLYGGSADLARSDGTFLNKFKIINKDDFTGRNIKYGVREFGMASIAAGMALSGFFIPFVGTFLAFSDYMRNAIRITAMMKIQVIYQLTHDSFLIGEDGPTHQPVEQIAALRAIPNLRVIRPADVHEVRFSWLAALTYSGPTALILSRQDLLTVVPGNISFAEGLAKGAYIIKKEESLIPEIIILATGSEVALALEVANFLQSNDGVNVRVVSMPCWEIFEEQTEEYKNNILCTQDKMLRVSIEAGIAQGWHRYVGSDGLTISLEHFGESGSPLELCHKFGFTKMPIIDRIKTKIREHKNAIEYTT